MTQFRFLKSRDDYYRHFTALDIGTDLVKALVVRRETPNGHVLGVSREPQHPDAMVGGVPGQVVVGIAGEMVKGFSSSIAYPRERPVERVRESELRNMLQLVEKRALREAQ